MTPRVGGGLVELRDHCSKACIQAEIERAACQILCTANFSPEEQACRAEIDGETCEGQQACAELGEDED